MEEKLTWDVELKAIDAKSKIKVIKEVRGLLGLGLKEVIFLKGQRSCRKATKCTEVEH